MNLPDLTTTAQQDAILGLRKGVLRPDQISTSVRHNLYDKGWLDRTGSLTLDALRELAAGRIPCGAS